MELTLEPTRLENAIVDYEKSFNSTVPNAALRWVSPDRLTEILENALRSGVPADELKQYEIEETEGVEIDP